jgi:hypothetical protein
MEEFDTRRKTEADARAKARLRLNPRHVAEGVAPVISCYAFEKAAVRLEIRSDNGRIFFRTFVTHCEHAADRARRAVGRKRASHSNPVADSFQERGAFGAFFQAESRGAGRAEKPCYFSSSI